MQFFDKQHQYFTVAYQTGSDIWTHIPYRFIASEMLFPQLQKDVLILDLGSGRGLWTKKIIQFGHRAIGIDYVEPIVRLANQMVHSEHIEHQLRFIEGNVLSIPFTDKGFDAATDIGTFQHLKKEEWKTYQNELVRVLKDDALYLNISLSKRTHAFLGFHPSSSEQHQFEKFGVSYYFFEDQEIPEIFQENFTVLDQRYQKFDSNSDPMDDVVMLFTLMKKR